MPDKRVTDVDLVRWSEALAGIARTGLAFTNSLYEQERFEEVLRVAADIRVAADHDGGRFDADEVVAGWMASVGEGVAGYITPKVAVGAIVGNERQELLLIQRGDSGVWLYPTGWADVGYSAAEVVVKEVAEETGIDVVPVRLVAVFDGLRLGARGLPFYSLVFQCRAIGGELRPHPLEARAVGWFAEDAMPGPLAGGGHWQNLAFRAIRDERFDVVFDSPRPSTWRS
jgi:ADP-ribose pyrophosphatase YjhB (NUDIX family)